MSTPSTTDESNADAARGVLSLKYKPTAGPLHCPCGDAIGAPHATVANVPRCTECLPDLGWAPWQHLVEPLDDLDVFLAEAPDYLAGTLYTDALDMLFQIGDARVAGGRESTLPDRVFADELIRRRPENMDVEEMFRLLALLAPHTTRAEVDKLFKDAQIRSARASAQIGDAEVAMLLLARTPGDMTMRDAVAHHGIDYSRFHGGVLTACAEMGCDPSDLPVDVVNDILATSKENS